MVVAWSWAQFKAWFAAVQGPDRRYALTEWAKSSRSPPDPGGGRGGGGDEGGGGGGGDEGEEGGEQPLGEAEPEIEQPVEYAEFEIEQPIGEANEIEQPVGEAEAFVPRSVPLPGRRGGGRGRGPQNVGVAVAGRGQRGGGRGRGPSRVAVGEPGNEELGEPPLANWAGGVRPGAWSAGDRDPWTGVERGAAGQAVKRQVTSAARIFLENKRLNEELRTRRLQMWTEQLDQNDAEQRTEEERLEAEADLRWNEAVAAETAREAEDAASRVQAHRATVSPPPPSCFSLFALFLHVR